MSIDNKQTVRWTVGWLVVRCLHNNTNTHVETGKSIVWEFINTKSHVVVSNVCGYAELVLFVFVPFSEVGTLAF